MKKNRIKVFVVDVRRGTYGTDEIENTLDAFYKVIGCDTIDITHIKIDNIVYDVILDDDGWYDRLIPMVSAIDANRNPVFVGTLIFTRHNETGETVSLEDGDARILSRYMLRVSSNAERKEEDDRARVWWVLQIPQILS